MEYERIEKGTFLERPNRFIAYVEIAGREETVHVKNTGRCKELLVPGADVYVQRSVSPDRKTGWDLISVRKGERIINMDSQIPNLLVEEWLKKGNLFSKNADIRREKTYKKSRFDIYVEDGERKAFIEVKGVTLEENGIVRFPDAPSDRAVKHVEELMEAKQEGYETYIFFVVQMRGVKKFMPNETTHPAFAKALRRAEKSGVHLLAYDCRVGETMIEICSPVPVQLFENPLEKTMRPLLAWFQENKRQLPWRQTKEPYKIWVSEIMLQQTRVEAVKPFYERFLKELPDVPSLASAEEDKLLKLWEGLGYYNRVRNMQKAAQEMMEKYGGTFPDSFEEILGLSGIGNYTAGAVASIAFDVAKPAVDGNVLRVLSRILGSYDDIMRQSTRKKMEELVEQVIPKDTPGDFNQSLIELGALVCVPNGEAKCSECPVSMFCCAREKGIIGELPVKKKAKERKIEKRTILIFKDGEKAAIRKRPKKGLLAGLYELPGVNGHLSVEEVIAYSKTIGLMPIHVKKLGEAKHIFSHVEWRMIGYAVQVDELEKSCTEDMIFIHPKEIEKSYPIPAAFEAYTEYMDISLGQKGQRKAD